ncbi:hypothetical protein D3C81_1584970 [compost metagenome]
MSFENNDAFTNGMNGTAWYVEEIASFDRHFGQKLIPLTVFNHMNELFFTGCFMAINNFSARFSFDNIPAFGFTKLTIFMYSSVFIVWMYLNG